MDCHRGLLLFLGSPLLQSEFDLHDERERERENDFRGERKERESEREKKGTICLRPREREGSVCTQMLNSFLAFDTLDKIWFLVFNMQNVKNLAYLIVVLLQTKSHSYQTL